MQHLALYRKYRPKKWSDVIGQDQLVTLLENAVKNNKPSHAYLFCGGRGTGKTTIARIFATLVGCNDEDIIEIDAASNRGIDEIRELREAVRTAPFSSPYKVYIIDEAHMLTKEAANALLKTLEEPPSHVLFILATTDEEKLPATIISRCQKMVFKSPSIETLSSYLIDIANKEGKTLDKEASLLIARHGKGSYRDALGYLEQALSGEDKVVSLEHVANLFGEPDKEKITALLLAFCEGDEKKIIDTVLTLKKKGNAMRSYDEFIEMVRTELLTRINASSTKDNSSSLGQKFPLIINSNLILELLEKRKLLSVSEAHTWTAFEAVLITLLSEKKV